MSVTFLATALVVVIVGSVVSDRWRRRRPRRPRSTVPPTRSLHVRPTILALGALWALAVATPDVSKQLSNGVRAAILAVLVVNFLFAVVTVRATTFDVVGQPELVFIGDDASLTVAVHGPKSPVMFTMVSSPNARSVTASDGDLVDLAGTARFRGVPTWVTIQVRSDGPLGFIGFSHTHGVAIRPMWVAPRPDAPDELLPAIPAAAASAGPAASSDSGTPVSVREFVPGDSRQRVSWPVSARVGRLMAKTFEEATANRVLMAVRLDPSLTTTEADEVCARAFWLGASVLERGWTLQVSFMTGRGVPALRTVERAGLHQVLAEAAPGLLPFPTERPALVVAHDRIAWL
jgi:uncharacterized protein (DUF58 family)